MNNILEYELWKNTLYDYIIAASILVVAIVLIHIFKGVLTSRLKDDESTESGVLNYRFIIRSISRFLIPLLYLGALYMALNTLETTPTVDKVFRVIYLVIDVYIVVRFIRTVLEFIISKYGKDDQKQYEYNRIRPLLGFVNFALYIIGILFILDNLGFQISTIIAGLGIGGIAIALAAQAVLGDLFSYFVIYFDKPFELGDFIIFDDKFGVIEKIGIKTTKIRALSGELLVTSNSYLTNNRIHNYKQMHRRRVVFKFGVVYQTPAEQLEKIPKLVKEIIEGIDNTTFDRAHFFKYGDFSLDFEVVYYVGSSDYIIYMDIQQDINLKLYRAFEEMGVEFAYPTQTLYMNKVNGENAGAAESGAPN